jgi:hypothetical protein
MKKESNINPFDTMRINEEKDHLREYPLYPDDEDIYNKSKEEDEIDPEDISKIKKTEVDSSESEEDFEDNESGNELDIPGSELDDEQEMIGSEDEENNYYSLGGDDHNDLDEDIEGF